MQRHELDLLNILEGGWFADYLIRFAASLDPNGSDDVVEWPQFSTEKPILLTLLDGDTHIILSNDTYRMEGMNAMIDAQFTHTIL
jgi:acetylcholinesterase